MILHQVLPRSFAKQSQTAAVQKPTGGIMMKRISAFVLLASALLATSESSGANLLINGSFENTGATYVNGGAGYMALYGSESAAIPGWTAKDIDWMGWVAPGLYWTVFRGYLTPGKESV